MSSCNADVCAGMSLDNMAPDMEPLFEAICREVQAPVVKEDAPLQMLVSDTLICSSRSMISSLLANSILKEDAPPSDVGALWLAMPEGRVSIPLLNSILYAD